MMTRLLTYTRVRTLLFLALCCLCVFATTASSRQAPAVTFSTPTLEVYSVNGPPISWKARATSTVAPIPKFSTLYVGMKFEKQTGGAGAWAQDFLVEKNVANASGKYEADSGENGLSAAPGKGDKYRVTFFGHYETGNPPVKTVISTVISSSLTPVP